MSLTVFACAACGRTVFPARALCPACGGREWREIDADGGVVQAATSVAGVHLAEIRTDAGPLVVARAPAPAAPGQRVRLDADRGAPRARPAGADGNP